MPFLTDIIRSPANEIVKSFPCWPNYYYRLANGTELPMNIGYGWCHRCEDFVEIEELETCEEIEHRVNRLLKSKPNWSAIDAGEASRWATMYDYELPTTLTCAAICQKWEDALRWRQNRKSPPRCLECGSFFAIVPIPKDGAIANLSDGGTVRCSVTTHASISELPDTVVFDEEGNRVETVPYDAWRASHAFDKV